MRAFVFPGQGSQNVGMGKALYDAFAEAKEVFQEVDDTLNYKLSKIIFDGPIEDLTLTEHTQPALMATSIATLRVLLKQGGKPLAHYCNFVAGHSLGEYSALAAADSLSLADTAKLLKIRGRSMQEAVPAGQGAMAAVIGLDFADVEAVVQMASKTGICELANDNSPGQVVVSGDKAGVEAGEAFAKEKGAKRYLLLNVSAPFHCSLMQPAANQMAAALAETKIKSPVVPLVANVTAQPTLDPEMIKKQLVSQVTGRVRWRETVEYLAAKGIASTIEIGAGKVLSGLSKRIAPTVEGISVQSPEDIEAFLKLMA